jgi:hypothetical protein
VFGVVVHHRSFTASHVLQIKPSLTPFNLRPFSYSPQHFCKSFLKLLNKESILQVIKYQPTLNIHSVALKVWLMAEGVWSLDRIPQSGNSCRVRHIVGYLRSRFLDIPGERVSEIYSAIPSSRSTVFGHRSTVSKDRSTVYGNCNLVS